MTAVTAAEEIRVGGVVIRFLVEGSATAGTAALFEFDVPAGSMAPPPHSHESWEETIYGVRGTLTWTVDGVATDVSPGEVLVIPRGVVHRFENLGTEPATQLASHHSGRARAGVLPRAAGGHERRRAARSVRRPRGDAPPRAHAGPLSSRSAPRSD